MKKILIRFTASVLLYSSIASTHAQARVVTDATAHLIDQYIQDALTQQLDQHKTWQRLLYLDAKGRSSKVNYAGFFLSTASNEHFSAKQELKLSLHAIFSALEGDQAFACRFPARYEWLINQLNIPSAQLAELHCEAFDTWFNTIQPHKMTMIFATDYMGNPSSMFGHTLLRLDPAKSADLNLVSYALNYAATPDTHDNDFAYAWKGLTGKYPSQYSLMPYYHKVKEYGDLESRDLWEYELNLSPEATAFIVKHIWELQEVEFPYYFIDDNCAYALLGLFDLTHPALDLQAQFDHVAVPVETIKALQKANLIQDVVYRPALETQLLSQAKQHGTALAKHAHHLTQLPAEQYTDYLAQFSELEQAKILEMAYDDLYLSFLSHNLEKDIAQPRLRALLKQRSQMNIEKQRQAPQVPQYEPLQGHHARMLMPAISHVQDQHVFELRYRQAYHDLIDPPAAYRFGTQLVFLEGNLQLSEDKLKLEHLKLMSVNAFNPITPFKIPLSWGMQLSWQQESMQHGAFSDTKQHGVVNLNAQAGYSLGDMQQNYLCYAQLQGIAQFSKHLDQGWRIAPAPTLGCLNQWSEQINSTIQLEAPFWFTQNDWNLRLNSQWQYAMNPQHAVRLNWQYQLQDQRDWHKFSLGYAHYF